MMFCVRLVLGMFSSGHPYFQGSYSLMYCVGRQKIPPPPHFFTLRLLNVLPDDFFPPPEVSPLCLDDHPRKCSPCPAVFRVYLLSTTPLLQHVAHSARMVQILPPLIDTSSLTPIFFFLRDVVPVSWSAFPPGSCLIDWRGSFGVFSPAFSLCPHTVVLCSLL